MKKCPQCGGEHTLSQCQNWRVPAGFRVLSVALAPHIKDAIRECGVFQPEPLWAAIIARHDLVGSQAGLELPPHGDLLAEAHAVFDLMLIGCSQASFGDYQNGDGETIGPRMDALHAALRSTIRMRAQ